MATHDYVISNGTGSAVRSDINGALAAIVSQNSNASEPATMYAYQWWADTTTGLLKIRNAANSAWVTIGTLASANLGLLPLAGGTMTGVLAVTAGTAALPGIAVSGDTNTGIYSPGADQVAISTGGTGRLFVTSAGLVGIGTTGPNTTLSVVGGISGGVVTATSDIALPSVATNSYLRLLGQYQAGTGRGGTIQLGGRSFSDSGNVGAFLISANSTGNNNTTDLTISTQTSFNNVISDIVTVTATGRVGIGSTSPGVKVDILSENNTSLASVLRVNSNNVAVNTSLAYDGLVGSGQLTVQAGASAALIFGSSATEKARLDSSGRLLVGTSSARGPGDHIARLQVEGTGYASSTASVFANSNDAFGSYVFLGKSRGTAVGSNTVVQSGDSLGQVRFSGTDGTGAISAAFIETFVDGTPGANDMPGRLVFSTTADGAASPTPRAQIDSVGRPFFFTSGNGILSTTTAAAGTTTTLFSGNHSSGGGFTGGSASVYIWSNGNIQNTNNSYGAISDAKLKENIVDAGSQWDDLKALRVVNYNFKPETKQETHKQLGLIAQEVELVSPGLVTESPDRDEEGNDLGTVTKGVNYSVLYMKAVKALQEAMERIEALEADVAALKGA